MQPTPILITFTGSAGATTKSYGLFDGSSTNKSVYTEGGAGLQAKDKVELYRSFPKKNGNFLGMIKSSLKHTKDVTVKDAQGNDSTVPAIITISVSVPLGISDNACSDMLLQNAEFLKSDAMKELALRLEI